MANGPIPYIPTGTSWRGAAMTSFLDTTTKSSKVDLAKDFPGNNENMPFDIVGVFMRDWSIEDTAESRKQVWQLLVAILKKQTEDLEAAERGPMYYATRPTPETRAASTPRIIVETPPVAPARPASTPKAKATPYRRHSRVFAANDSPASTPENSPKAFIPPELEAAWPYPDHTPRPGHGYAKMASHHILRQGTWQTAQPQGYYNPPLPSAQPAWPSPWYNPNSGVFGYKYY